MDNIHGTLLLAFYCSCFFVVIIYIFLFTFMFTYCVKHLTSLEACLVSEHFGRNNSKIKNGSHITELWQTTYLSLMTTVECTVGCRSRSASRYLSLLLFGLFLCFTLLLLLVVFPHRNHCSYAFKETLPLSSFNIRSYLPEPA